METSETEAAGKDKGNVQLGQFERFQLNSNLSHFIILLLLFCSGMSLPHQ